MAAGAATPSSSTVTGKLHGKDFTLDKVEMSNGILELRQGTNFWPEAAVKIFLFTKKGESLEGRTVRIGDKQDFRGPSAHVHLEWSKGGDSMPETEMFMNDFKMLLQFGKRTNYRMPAKISLTLPDKLNSHLSGTFTVGPEDDESTEGAVISGKIIFKGGVKSLPAALGCEGKTIAVNIDTLGKGPDGRLEGPGSALSLDGTLGGATCTSWRPRNSTLSMNDGTLTHRHVNRPPGAYLIMVRGSVREPAKAGEFQEVQQEGCLDWKWLTVKDAKDRIPLDLTIAPEVLGTLEVSMSNAPDNTSIAYLPLDAEGELPLAEGLSYYNSARQKLVNGKAVIRWLKEGRYRLLPVDSNCDSKSQASSVDVVIKRGATSKVDLNNPVQSPPPGKSAAFMAMQQRQADYKTLSPHYVVIEGRLKPIGDTTAHYVSLKPTNRHISDHRLIMEYEKNGRTIVVAADIKSETASQGTADGHLQLAVMKSDETVTFQYNGETKTSYVYKDVTLTSSEIQDFKAKGVKFKELGESASGQKAGANEAIGTTPSLNAGAADDNKVANTAQAKQAPMLYYPLADSPDGKVADKSGSGNDGSAVDVEWMATGRRGTSARFNGVNSHIQVSLRQALNAEADITVSLWVKTKANMKGWEALLGTEAFRIEVCPDGCIHWDWTDDRNIFTKANVFSLGKWTHLAFVRRNRNLTIFVDGSQVHGQTNARSSLGVQTMCFGKDGLSKIGGDDSYSGQMDEIRVFGRALSYLEVRALSHE